MKALVAASLGLVMAGCATSVPVPLVVSGETVLIRGIINESTAKDFKAAVNRDRVSRVLIASGGGLVEPALQIAHEILARKLDVEVVGDCFSSCANYIFPAGATKSISGLGIVAWHGNMGHLIYLHDTGKKLLTPVALAEVRRLAQLENDFFGAIALDSYLCWFGKIEPYNARNLYFLDVEDMARFGLVNIKVRTGYARTDVSAYGTPAAATLKYLKVDWANLHRPAQPQ